MWTRLLPPAVQQEFPTSRPDGQRNTCSAGPISRTESGPLRGGRALTACLGLRRGRGEVKGGGVDAVTQPSGLRPIIEDVAEMSLALAAQNFGSVREQTEIHG